MLSYSLAPQKQKARSSMLAGWNNFRIICSENCSETGCHGTDRTCDHLLNRQALYRLSYMAILGDSGRIRTCFPTETPRAAALLLASLPGLLHLGVHTTPRYQIGRCLLPVVVIFQPLHEFLNLLLSNFSVTHLNAVLILGLLIKPGNILPHQVGQPIAACASGWECHGSIFLR